MKNNFLQRTITGIIFVAVLVGCILGGPISFTVLFAFVSALTIREFGNLVNATGKLLGISLEECCTKHQEDTEVILGKYAFVGNRPQVKNQNDK